MKLSSGTEAGHCLPPLAWPALAHITPKAPEEMPVQRLRWPVKRKRLWLGGCGWRRKGQRRGEEGGEREEIQGRRRGGRLQAVLLKLGSLRGRWCEAGGRAWLLFSW